MVVWIMVCSCEKWTFCCITNEKALKPCFLIRFLSSKLFNFSNFSITLIEYFICNIGITIQILLYKGAIHCSVQIPLNCLCWHVTNCAIYFCFLYYYILYICCVDTNMLSPVNRLVHKSMWHILKSMFSKIQHLNLKMYSLLFCLL